MFSVYVMVYMCWAGGTLHHFYSSFSMKMVLNCIHIWSVDLFIVKYKVLGRKLIKMAAL